MRCPLSSFWVFYQTDASGPTAQEEVQIQTGQTQEDEEIDDDGEEDEEPANGEGKNQRSEEDGGNHIPKINRALSVHVDMTTECPKGLATEHQMYETYDTTV